MSFQDFGGPYNLDNESRRLAYMLNTGDPRAEHAAAMELSQDLYGLPTQAGLNLLQRTQMYENPNMGAQLEFQQVTQPTYNPYDGQYDGPLAPTGQELVYAIDPNTGVQDYVTTMNAAPTADDGGNFNPYYGVNGLAFDVNLGFGVWNQDQTWRDWCFRDREWWQGRQDWQSYNGHMNMPQPIYDIHNTTINNTNITNIYNNRTQNIYNPPPVPPHSWPKAHIPHPEPVGPARSTGGAGLPSGELPRQVIQRPVATGEPRTMIPKVDPRFAAPTNQTEHLAPAGQGERYVQPNTHRKEDEKRH